MGILTWNANHKSSKQDCQSVTRFTNTSLSHHALPAIRSVIAISILIPALAIGDDASKAPDDFYITVTADDLFLCGEGFGGLYGCIDEAISREARSVVISASSQAAVQAVQELVNAVHSVGFEQVGVTTFDEPGT